MLLSTASRFADFESTIRAGEQLARVAEQVADCLTLRRREGAAAQRYLEGFGGGED